MSDTAANKIWQYGTTADRMAFTPDPAVGSQLLYCWYDTDETNFYSWDGSSWILIGGSGSLGISQLTGDVTAGPGTGSQAATLANTAVTPASYTSADITVDSKGRITAASNGGGGSAVTSLTGDVTGTGPGATATTLANTAVTPGSYTSTNLTVDSKGRITTAANGSGGTGTVTTTGSPASGNLTKFTGSTSISNADLTGDVTTSGTVATTIANGAVTAAKSATNLKTRSINFIIDGGGSAITTGIKGDIGPLPFNGTITKATLLADQSGSIVIDIWKDTYANYPPTIADTIVASAPPTISGATKSQDSTLTGWTTSFSSGDTLRYNVNSVTTITRVAVTLEVTVS